MQSPFRYWLSRQCREQLYRMQDETGRFSLRAWINNNRVVVLGAIFIAFLLLALVLGSWLWPAPDKPSLVGRQAWFYDLNTGVLFKGRGKQLGPIGAPSGPLPDGTQAGFRAHVYSYVVNPSADELFVGFIERPDPLPGAPRPTRSMDDFQLWCQGRQIKRIDDTDWVAASSPQGEKIIEELSHPNKRGQTPIYHVPR